MVYERLLPPLLLALLPIGTLMAILSSSLEGSVLGVVIVVFGTLFYGFVNYKPETKYKLRQPTIAAGLIQIAIFTILLPLILYICVMAGIVDISELTVLSSSVPLIAGGILFGSISGTGLPFLLRTTDHPMIVNSIGNTIIIGSFIGLLVLAPAISVIYAVIHLFSRIIIIGWSISSQ